MNELRRHKKSDKIKWVLTGIAFVLVAVMLTGICLQLFGTGKQKPSEWFNKPDTEQTAPVGGEEENGEVVGTPTALNVLCSASPMRAAAASSEIVKTVSYSTTNTLTNGATLNRFKNVINSHSYDGFSYKITLRPSSSEFDTSTMGEVAYVRSITWWKWSTLKRIMS